MSYEIISYNNVAAVESQRASDGLKATSMCAMSIVGDDLYCIKSRGKFEDGTKYPAILYRVKNFNSTSRTITYNTILNGSQYNIFRHANGMTYYRKSGESKGTFYIATMNPRGNGSQIIGVNASGTVTKHIAFANDFPTLGTNDYVSSIAYYNSERFIIGVDKTSTTRKYYLVEFENDTTIRKIASFNVNIESSYTKGNDIFYDSDTGYFYICLFIDSSPVQDNLILCYNLSSGIQDGATYSSIRQMRVQAASSENMFEIEGIAIHNNIKYVVTNALDLSGEEKDGIYKLKKPSTT